MMDVLSTKFKNKLCDRNVDVLRFWCCINFKMRRAHREGLMKQEAEVIARPGYYNDHASTLRGSYETGSGSLCARLTVIMTKHIERVL